MKSNVLRTTFSILLLLTVAVPASVDAGTIILWDSRNIQGSVYAQDNVDTDGDGAPEFGSNASDSFSQSPPSTAPWIAADTVAVSQGTATAAGGASQDSYVGPLAFGGIGTSSGSAAATEFDYANAWGISYYYVGFEITEQSYNFVFDAGVNATAIGDAGGYGYGYAYLYSYDTGTYVGGDYATAYAYAGNPVSTDTLHLTGVLAPGNYYLYGYAYSNPYAGTYYGYGATLSTTTDFDINLTLTPSQAVPEPAEPIALALLATLFIGAAALRWKPGAPSA